MAVPAPPRPSSSNGFYSINNQFLLSGPKGWTEFETLEKNLDLFVRLDFPGVPEQGIKLTLEKNKKAVIVQAFAPKVHEHDSSHRSYLTMTGLVCKCCEITSFTSHVVDGVLRLLISKTAINPQRPSCLAYLRNEISEEDRLSKGPMKFPHGTDPQDPKLSGPVLQPHPNVLEGSNLAYESKKLGNGKLYVRVDMPGVPKDNFIVSVTNGRVNVTGLAPAVSHDSSGRFYCGDVAILSSPVDIPSSRIKTIAKNGVIRLLVPSV